jgi:hypothetical protein
VSAVVQVWRNAKLQHLVRAAPLRWFLFWSGAIFRCGKGEAGLSDTIMEQQCPVVHSAGAGDAQRVDSACPVDHGTVGKCPVDHEGAGPNANHPLYNPRANDMVFGQDRQVGQKVQLSTERAVSSIPMGDFSPAHQPKDSKQWVYPSEQQYYNAIKRKGYRVSETEVPSVLYVHNNVNEQGWTKVKEWEAYCGNDKPKLKRFMGKPTEMSPAAMFKVHVQGYEHFPLCMWLLRLNCCYLLKLMQVCQAVRPARLGGGAPQRGGGTLRDRLLLRPAHRAVRQGGSAARVPGSATRTGQCERDRCASVLLVSPKVLSPNIAAEDASHH